MKEETVSINDLKVNYKIAGSGPAILILHGWGGSSASWIKVQKILADQGYKVIVPDFPGFGKSETPPEPWGTKEYDDLILKLAKKFELNNFFLLGHSFGGQVAVRVTVNHPERIKKLILSTPAAIRPKPGLKVRIIFQIARIGNAIFSPKYLVRVKDYSRNIFYIFLRHRDYVKANRTMKETIKKLLSEDLFPELSKIKTETLIVWGKIDKILPVRYAYILNENIKDSKLEILPKIGHSPHLEVPEKLSEIITRFLRT